MASPPEDKKFWLHTHPFWIAIVAGVMIALIATALIAVPLLRGIATTSSSSSSSSSSTTTATDIQLVNSSSSISTQTVSLPSSSIRISVARNQTASTTHRTYANLPNVNVTYVKSGMEPDSVAIDASGQYAYVTNFGSGNITVINIAMNNDTVIGALQAGYTPDSIFYDPLNGNIYVTNFYSDGIAVLSPNDNSNPAMAKLNIPAEPSSLMFNPLDGTVYAMDRAGDILKVSTSNVSTLATVALKPGFQASAAVFDEANHQFYVATSNATQGIVYVLDQNGKSLVAEVNVGAGPDALAIDSANGEVIVASSESNTVSVIDPSTNNSLIATIPVDGDTPSGVCYDPLNGYVFETNEGSGTILAINGANYTIVGEIQLPPDSEPQSILCGGGLADSSSNMLYVPDWAAGDLAIISIG